MALKQIPKEISYAKYHTCLDVFLVTQLATFLGSPP